MSMKSLLTICLALVCCSSSKAEAQTSPAQPVFNPSEQRTENAGRDQRVDERIRMLEGLLAHTDEEERAELVYSATLKFLSVLRDEQSKEVGVPAAEDPSHDLSDPKNYRIRLRCEEGVLYVQFLPKSENIRGGGWEIGVEKETGAIVGAHPMM